MPRPLSNMFGYANSIRSLTKVRGSCILEPHDYREDPEAKVRQMLGDSLD